MGGLNPQNLSGYATVCKQKVYYQWFYDLGLSKIQCKQLKHHFAK